MKNNSKDMLIYKIYNDINDKLYIGQTSHGLNARMQNHKSAMMSNFSNQEIHQAMRKYGWDKFHFEVIEYCNSIEELNEREIYWISYYDSVNSGYNMGYGGDINVMKSEKVLNIHNERMHDSNVRNQISESLKETINNNGGVSETTRKKQSESRLELYHSERGEAIKEKFRKSYKMTPEHIEATNRGKYKQVKCIDEEGNIIQIFKCVKDGAQWWYEHGFNDVKNVRYLSTVIKRSADNDTYIRGIKWKYLKEISNE